MKVMAVAAHPDDEVLGVGGTLAGHAARGDEVKVVIVSEGGSSRYDHGQQTLLAKNAGEAQVVLGVRHLQLLGLPDQKLDAMPLIEVVRAIEATVADFAPDVVYTHHFGDLNRDHRVVCEATMVACRPVGETYPRHVYLFETPSSSEWGWNEPGMQFLPNHFVDVSAHLETKLLAMACYPSEVRVPPHPRAIESLRTRAAFWGQVVSRPFAEPFVLVRELV